MSSVRTASEVSRHGDLFSGETSPTGPASVSSGRVSLALHPASFQLTRNYFDAETRDAYGRHYLLRGARRDAPYIHV